MQVTQRHHLPPKGSIPDEWSPSTVGGEFDVQLGKMLDAAKNTGTPKPYLGNRAVQWGAIDVQDLPTMQISQTELERFRLQNGDLLVCEGGEVGRAAIWTAPIDECYYQKALHRLRSTRGFSPQLMVYVLKHWCETGYLNNYVSQTSIAHLTREKLLEIPLAVPPAAEQRAIVSALSNIDALSHSLGRLIAKQRDIKQAAMQRLITGRGRLPGFSDLWTETVLGDVGECIIGLTYKPEDTAEHGTLVLRASNIQNEQLSFADNVYVNSPIPDKLRTRDGDILICVRNGSRHLIGKSVRLTDRTAGMTFGAFMSVFRTRYSRFIAHAIRSYCIQQQVQENLGATINQITNANLRAFKISLPPFDEQLAISAVLDTMDDELFVLQARLEKTLLLKQGMMQQLLTGRVRLI